MRALGLVIAVLIAGCSGEPSWQDAGSKIVAPGLSMDYTNVVSTGDGSTLGNYDDLAFEAPEFPPNPNPAWRKMVQIRPSYAIAAFGGHVLGSNRGEWGGELAFRRADGGASILLHESVSGLAQSQFGILAFTGIAHLSLNEGAIYKVLQTEAGVVIAVPFLSLPGAPTDIFMTAEGDVLFRVHNSELGRRDCYLLTDDRRIHQVDCSRVVNSP